MLRGRFGGTSGRPFLEGRLTIPRLNLSHDISFLVDTGADRSVLLVDDTLLMGVDYSNLTLGQRMSVGIGGTARHFVEPAIVTFSEPRRYLHVYEIDLAIVQFNQDLTRMPSLLGRDILDRWRMTYNPEKKRLSFHVWSADHTITV